MTSRLSTSLAASLANRVKMERRRYRKRLKRCSHHFSESAVHDLRVEIRRLLALLNLLRKLHYLGPLKKIRKVFKQRLDAFDELRDTHVQLSLLKPLEGQFPAARELTALLRQCKRQLTDELRQEVQTAKPARLMRKLKAVEKQLRKMPAKMPREAARKTVLAALRKAYDRVVKLRRRIHPNHLVTIHRTRVAFKNFRYVCESLRPFLPGLKKEGFGRMRDYQTLMGNIQDMEMLLAGVRGAVADKKISGRAVGPLRQDLLQRRRELIGLYQAAADRLFDFEPKLEKNSPPDQATTIASSSTARPDSLRLEACSLRHPEHSARDK
jgi:CHAD domain-containing protein